MSHSLVSIVIVFTFAALLNLTILSCICISIKRGKKVEILGTMDNFFYMKLIRLLLILSSIFLLIECIGFLVHYSFHNETTNAHFNTILSTFNINIVHMADEPLYVSDFMIYFGFISFLLCSVGAYYIALHRFLLTNRESKSTYDTQTCLHIICIICYIVISLTAIVFSFINLFITLSPTLYYVLLICIDLQLFLSSIPVLKSLKQVIEISRDSATAVRWSVTNVSPSKLFYKMSVKAVRISIENIILNILLIIDIAFNLYQIISIRTQTNLQSNGAIPRNIHSAHLIILYFIQLFIMLWLNDYAWVNRKYITVRKINTHPAPKRHSHRRTNFSDFDYNNTVLKLTRTVTPEHPLSVVKDHEIVRLKNATPEPQKSVESTDAVNALHRNDDLDELQFMKLSSKMKVHSVSLESSTYRSKRRLNKELMTQNTSYEPSNSNDSKVGNKRRQSVISGIHNAAKRMSRTIIENMISVDSIWDEQDLGDGARRWSRFQKPKPSKSPNKERRHSMPTNVSPKSSQRRTSLAVELNIPVFSPNVHLGATNSPPICSPLSQLETAADESAYKFAADSAKLDNITEIVSYKSPIGKVPTVRSLTLPSASTTLTTYASPKTYSPRHPSTAYSDPPSSLSENTATAKREACSAQTTVKRSKFFNYQPKLSLNDRTSNKSESASMPSLTPATSLRGCVGSMELSQLSDLSEGLSSIKKNVESMGKLEEESKEKGKKGPVLSFMETSIDEKMQSHNIQHLMSEMKRIDLDGIQSSGSPEPTNIVIVINDQTVHKSNANMTENANSVEIHDDHGDDDDVAQNPVPRVRSLEFDEEEMDDILQCIDEYQ